MKTRRFAIILASVALAAAAQSPSTTTVQGTVYNAAGAPISGTLQLTWPAFTTAASQAIAAGRLTVTIGSDGFLSVNLAPNMGAMPAGLYYTAVYHLADGTTSTEYWVVPAAPQATLAAVRAQVMPAAQAAQAVNKAYVDQAIQQYATSQVSTFGGTLTGPLYFNGDPLIPTQAADKHYVDAQFAQSLPSAGGNATGPITATMLGGVYQADQASGSDFTSKLQACINGLNATYGGTCDARNFTGSITMSAPLTIATANVTVQFPCATIATAYPIVVAAGTRNVTLHGCATRGTSSASGSQGGTVFLSSGSAALFQIGDSTYAADTSGFHLDNVAINTTAATAATAQALAVWRTQELQLTSLYLLGNSNQTALTLDGTGNYTGGTFQDIQIGGYLTAVNAIGHHVSNSATTDWLNASTFVRLHIDCPTSGGNPIAGTTGINLQQGDGNTITGGDVEGCATALHLGANAQNNTILGLRNENSTYQVIADPGSSYNNWMTGGTMFTGRLTDNGTRNSFLDTFHRSFNALNGDWYGSQQDTTLTNHFRLGIGSGNERGLLDRYQTDYGYRWTTGLSDATAGEQFYQVLDELNNVYRLSIGQYNNGQPSTNNQTILNSAGSGAVVLNGSNNAGTGGVVFGSGGVTSSTVATIDKSGNANFSGTLQVGGTSQSTGAITIRNNADAEVDYFLWPGYSSSQKGSFVYKDYNGNSQWYLVKDQNNNWAINSAIGGLDSFKAYQSTNSGDTYINASNSSGAVRVNYETGSGASFNIYGGNSSTLYAGFTGPAAIKFPGLAASSGHNCMQIDNSGWITNTGSACGAGTVGAGTAGQIAWYSASGTAVTGMAAVPLSAGGTGASNASAALANLGAVPASGGAMTGPLTGTSASFSGALAVGTTDILGGPSGTDLCAQITAALAAGYRSLKVADPTTAGTYICGSPMTWTVPLSLDMSPNAVIASDMGNNAMVAVQAKVHVSGGVWANTHTPNATDANFRVFDLQAGSDGSIFDGGIKFTAGRIAIMVNGVSGVRITNFACVGMYDLCIDEGYNATDLVVADGQISGTTQSPVGATVPPNDINLEGCTYCSVLGNHVIDGAGLTNATAACIQLYADGGSYATSVNGSIVANNQCRKTAGGTVNNGVYLSCNTGDSCYSEDNVADGYGTPFYYGGAGTKHVRHNEHDGTLSQETYTSGNAIIIGNFWPPNMTSSTNDVLVGVTAGWALTTGNYNTLIGSGAGAGNQTGAHNACIGYNACQNQNASSNAAVGDSALSASSTSGGNAALGYEAGTNSTGSYNVFLGYNAEPLAAADTNETVIGKGAAGNGSNTATIGNSGVTDVYAGQSGGAVVHAGYVVQANPQLGLISNVYPAGDTLCAKGRDTTVFLGGVLQTVTVTTGTDTGLPNSGTWTTTGGGGTGASGTFTAAGGNLQTVTISNGGSGYTANPTFVPNSGSLGTSTVAFSSCSNTSDATGSAVAFVTTYTIPGNSIATGTTYRIVPMFLSKTSSSPAYVTDLELDYGSTEIYQNFGSLVQPASLTTSPEKVTFTLSAPNNRSVMVTADGSITATASSLVNEKNSPVAITSSSPQTVAIRLYYNGNTAGNALNLAELAVYKDE